MRLVFLLMLALTASGQTLIPFYSDARYARDEPVDPPWWIHNNGHPSRLFFNGVYQSSESGPYDMGLALVWMIQPRADGVKVGVVSLGTAGDRVQALPGLIAPGCEIYRVHVGRWYPDVMAVGLLECVTNGCSVIAMDSGWSLPDATLSNACWVLGQSNVILCCSAPNAAFSLDTGMIDYPHHWRFPTVQVVTSVDRTGGLYPVAAWGSDVVACPGRNIVAAGTYSSGTSYAAPICAGVVALMRSRHPSWSAVHVLEVLRATCDGPIHRVNALSAVASDLMAAPGIELPPELLDE